MGTVRRIAKNSFFVFTGEIIMRLIAFFAGLILIRYLGSADFGMYSLIYTFISFFQIFMDMGIDSIIVRELAKDAKKGEELIGNGVTLKFFFSLVGIILCWVILQGMHYPLDIKMLIYIASLGMVFSFGTLFNDIFQAKLVMQYPTVINIMMKVILTALTIIFIFLKAKLFYFILINLAVYIAQVMIIFYQARKLLPVRLRMNFEIWKELLRQSWPLAVSTFFISIYTRIDQLLLFSMKGKEELGFYAASVKLAELPSVLVGAFIVSVFPLFSEYYVASPEAFKKIYEKSFKYLMMFIIPVAMLLMLYSRQVILACYGQSFLPSRISLAIL
ncbi:MAG: hypothetical protein A3K54_04485, partial [Omnitrophica WOR_2 bacterium RBG_13_44_8]